jgi:ATP-dependent Lhr-like helicase
MTSTFARFPPRLQEAIVSRLGWTSLRPVQELAGQALLDGLNAVILAPTAGGKTEASIFPLLANLMEKEPEGVGLIYIAPIKALLNNQADRLGIYTEMIGLSRFLWHGDVKNSEKRKFVREPTALLMTTPESLEVMLLSSKVPHPKLFQDLRAVVIDEVHALAGTDRGSHLMSVLERIAPHSNHDVQRVGLSATVGNPTDILKWLQGTSQRGNSVVDPPKTPSPKDLRIYLRDTKRAIAQEASQKAEGNKSLFFCQSRSLAEEIAEQMQHTGIEVFVHHSSVSLEERTAAEERFHTGTNTSIVCTSTLELGIDIGDLDLVFQANAPSTVSSFLQRLGRTGRRSGQRANTTFFCEDAETVLQAIAIIELARKGWVESISIHNRAWFVFVHQILALTLQHGAISSERVWDQLSIVPDFSEISLTEYEYLIEYMIRESFLYESSGLLSIGDKSERIYGRKNFLEIYSVFSSPQLYNVQTKSGRTVGYIEQNFVDKLVENISSFLLAGKSWTVVHINHIDKLIKVTPAPRGRKPTWGGFMPQLLSYEICQQIKECLLDSTYYPYLDSAAKASLISSREDNQLILRNGVNILSEPERLTWWTFAGGRINYTIKYGLSYFYDWKIVADNFKLRIEGDDINFSVLHSLIIKMSCLDFWEEESVSSFVLDQLPDYRLNKFQKALPLKHSLEMISRTLLDFSGATRLFGEFLS